MLSQLDLGFAIKCLNSCTDVHLFCSQLGSDSLSRLLEMVEEGTLEISKDQSGQREVKKSVLEYIQFNQYHLPMYAQPGLL